MGFETKQSLLDMLALLHSDYAEAAEQLEAMEQRYEASLLNQDMDSDLTTDEQELLDCLDELQQQLDLITMRLDEAEVLCDAAVMSNDELEDDEEMTEF